MTNTEKLDQFRRDIKSVCFWSKSIREINLELESIQVQKTNTSSNNYSSLNFDLDSSSYLPYRMKLNELERQLLSVRKRFIEKIKDVEEIFVRIDQQVEKDMMIDLYLLNEKYSKIAIKYSYAESTMFDRISKIILKVL